MGRGFVGLELYVSIGGLTNKLSHLIAVSVNFHDDIYSYKPSESRLSIIIIQSYRFLSLHLRKHSV